MFIYPQNTWQSRHTVTHVLSTYESDFTPAESIVSVDIRSPPGLTSTSHLLRHETIRKSRIEIYRNTGSRSVRGLSGIRVDVAGQSSYRSHLPKQYFLRSSNSIVVGFGHRVLSGGPPRRRCRLSIEDRLQRSFLSFSLL